MNNNVIILVGISGSGKSTFATSFLRENQNYLRINRDDIRRTLVGDLRDYYARKNMFSTEMIVDAISKNILINGLLRKYSFVIDNTNLKLKYFQNIIENAKDRNYTIQFKLFDVDLKNAKNRVFFRDYSEYIFNYEDGNTDFSDNSALKYIDKQYEDYQAIKQYILKNYESQIIQ